MRGRLVAVLVIAALVSAACAGDDGAAPVPTLFDDSTSTSEPAGDGPSAETTVTTTTVPIRERLPALPTDVDGAVRSTDGFLQPILAADGEVWIVRGACRAESVEPAATAVLVGPQHVVLDPGAEWGTEKAQLLLDLTADVADRLRAEGVIVELTRTTDAALSPLTRAEAGAAVGARLLVTLALGIGRGEGTDDPRPVVFHEIDDVESQRAAGLAHEHVAAALAGIDGDFEAMDEPGVRPLLNQRGEDYFTVMRSSGDVPAIRVEVMADGERETALLAMEEGRSTIAAALAEAIARFLVTDEAGSGYVDPTETIRQAPTANTLSGCPE